MPTAEQVEELRQAALAALDAWAEAYASLRPEPVPGEVQWALAGLCAVDATALRALEETAQ